jgi:hypothetical protein
MLSWPFLRPVLQNFPYRWSVAECSISIQIFAEKSFFDHKLSDLKMCSDSKPRSCCIFWNTSLRILHHVPDSSSLTLERQVLSHEPTKLCRKIENFGNFGFWISKLSFWCSVAVSSLTIWSIWVFIVHVLLVEQAYECVTNEKWKFSDGGLDTQHSEWFRWF